MVLTFLATLTVHLRYNVPLWIIFKRLERYGNKPSTLQILKDPQSIFESSDTPEVRALKQKCIDKWAVCRRMLSIEVTMMFSGMLLSILVTWLIYFLEGKS